MLYADNVNDQLLQRKLAIRDNSAKAPDLEAVMKSSGDRAQPVTVVDLQRGCD